MTILSKLDRVKNLIYEAEGLLELATARPDKELQLVVLAKKKAEECLAGLTSIIAGEALQDVETDKETNTGCIMESACGEDQCDEPSAATGEKEKIKAFDQVRPDTCDDSLEYVLEEETDSETARKAAVKASELYKEEAAVGTVDDHTVVSGVTDDSEFTQESKGRRPAFCLNDRFRFRRTLFGGSDMQFNAAMDKVAAMGDYDEAEAYFVWELGMDLDDPDVTDFMEIIKNYFGS